MLVVLFSGCAPGGYYYSTSHRGLRNNPYYSYPPGGYHQGGNPEESYRWAEAQRAWAQTEREWARAEAARAAAAREWYRTDREGRSQNREKNYVSREVDYIFRDTFKVLGSETRREIRRSIRDLFR